MIKNSCWLKDCCNHIDCDKDFCMREYKINYLYDQAGLSLLQRQNVRMVPIGYEYLTDEKGKDILDENGREIPTPAFKSFLALGTCKDNIVNFVKDGSNLLIHSTQCGNGKTTWAIKLAQAYINKIWPSSDLKCRVLFINVPRFLLELKRNIDEKSEYISHIKDNVLDCDLVIWDEIGTKDLTVFEHENVLSLINARLDSGKSNIYTSNLNERELKESLGDRLYSRIVNMSYNIEIYGLDMRRVKMNEKLQSGKNTL